MFGENCHYLNIIEINVLVWKTLYKALDLRSVFYVQFIFNSLSKGTTENKFDGQCNDMKLFRKFAQELLCQFALRIVNLQKKKKKKKKKMLHISKPVFIFIYYGIIRVLVHTSYLETTCLTGHNKRR